MSRTFVIAAASIVLSATSALAEVNQAVKDACRDDYHKLCDKLEVGSEELRVCMRSKATDISPACLKALVDNKEVTKEDIDRYLIEMEEKAKAQK